MGKKEEMQISKEILDYIEQQHKKGFKAEQIRAKLLEAGHESHIVEHHIRHFHSKKRASKIILIILILLIIVVVYAVFTTRTTENYIQDKTTATIPEEKENNPQLENIKPIDLSICERFLEPRDKKGCTIEITYFNKLTPEQRKTIQEVSNKRDKSVCDNMDGFARQACADALMAKDASSVKTCTSLRTEYWKETCKGLYFSKIATEGSDYCKNIYLPIHIWSTCPGEVG